MYCVKCGVKLQDGTETCPLCQTPVWNPEQIVRERNFPDSLPERHRDSGRPLAVAMLVLAVVEIIVVMIVCFRLYGELRWGGYAIGGISLFYLIAFLPQWFREPKGEIFVPVDHAAAALYVLYICVKTGGHWFLSFAFPIVIASCLISTAMICLLKYVQGGRLFIFGGFLIVMGCFTVLVEFFEHLSFGTPMFRWSLYSLSGFAAAGIFLLLCGMIPSMRHELERRFFF